MLKRCWTSIGEPLRRYEALPTIHCCQWNILCRSCGAIVMKEITTILHFGNPGNITSIILICNYTYQTKAKANQITWTQFLKFNDFLHFIIFLRRKFLFLLSQTRHEYQAFNAMKDLTRNNINNNYVAI